MLVENVINITRSCIYFRAAKFAHNLHFLFFKKTTKSTIAIVTAMATPAPKGIIVPPSANINYLLLPYRFIANFRLYEVK
jgi:hypothetical protein